MQFRKDQSVAIEKCIDGRSGCGIESSISTLKFGMGSGRECQGSGIL
jgi:hypothetical protein